MATTGQTIVNPVTHEHITFLRNSHDNADGAFVFDCRVTPGGATLPAHVHTTQSEHFTVIAGTLGVMLDGKKQVLQAGESVDLPARIKHQWWNAGDGEVRFRVEVRPARNLETILQVASRLANDGKLSHRGVPTNPFVLAIFARTAETYLPGIPIVLQDAGMTLGCTVAHLLGYGRVFARYAAARPNGDTPETAFARAA